MDREQEEMQFLGLFGIYKEAYKIIIRWRKIFSQITLALILPLAFIFLAHKEIANILFWKILHTEFELNKTKAGTKKSHHLTDHIRSEWITYYVFQAAYLTFVLVFSLLSTSAVVYTIACIYTGRDVTFNKVMSVVPKVWKRLLVTFLCTFVGFFAYNAVALLIIILWSITVWDWDSVVAAISFHVILFMYVVGFVYMTIIWQLASVVSVLEDTYGFKAMIKSKDLIKGKMLVALAIFFKLNFSLVAIQIVFGEHVLHGRWHRESFGSRFGFGILCLLLLFKLILIGLVVQTIIYFVCKSYHHENIDKSNLSEHLEGYLGDYEPLNAKDIQLEHYEV
ncbi:hypothetical protein RJ639_037144 [Escallonia herrerae]|uniref:Uncharacterized protein n=1 Tax=Escallonia herrerae TaxID=1293975 RepID=A0AA89BD12_9ASTE|nr:hypothetical protein RJ639_037144 [Escallonia herrerae]